MSQPRLLGGRYELDELIGRGGMAEVYRARDLRLDRVVAVKMLRPDLARDHTFQTRFRREAQSAASLNHPSIIAVYDTGDDDIDDVSIPYIIMEHVEGRTLKELLDDDRRLLPERCSEIIDGVLRALEYSHRNGIVHRDIKPANVMLTPQAEAKVMDFGIARATDDSQATMTQTSQVIGTAQYLSPEQARGERVDARSDLYSTGCVLYELLTGGPPFTGDSPVSIAYQHVREAPVPPTDIDSQIPTWLEEVVLRSMAKDREQRYQNAAEMREDIQRGLQGMSTAASTMAMATGGDTSSLPPVDNRNDDDPDDDFDDERKGRGAKAALWILLALAVIGALIFAGYLLNGSSAPEKTKIPDVADMSASKADSELTDSAGFTNVTQKKRNDDDVDKGDAIGTDPKAGEQVTKGTDITLYISQGPGEVQVPDVTGMSQNKAQQKLQNEGFKIGPTEQTESNSVEAGNVISTDPEGGSAAEPNSEVSLVISSGKEQVKVPDLSGMSKEDAQSALSEAGLSGNFSEEENPDEEEGKVFQQDPEADSEVDAGSDVNVKIAKAPAEEPSESPSDEPPPSDGGGDFPPEDGDWNIPDEFNPGNSQGRQEQDQQ